LFNTRIISVYTHKLASNK